MKIRLAVLLALICLVVAPLPVAQAADDEHLVALDQPFRYAHIQPDIDSVGAYEELTGHYNWNFHIHNNSDVTISSPTISAGELSPDFCPNVEFPVSLTSLDPGDKWYLVNAISSTFSFPFAPGYNSSRMMMPLVIPPEGDEQEVTVKVTPVDDQRYIHNPFMRVQVNGNVIGGSNTQPTGATPTVEEGQRVVWEFPWNEFKEYTFTVQLQVENPSAVANLVHKPTVQIYVESAEFLTEKTGTSTTIYDKILGGNITYSVASGDWQWHRTIADCWRVDYMPLSQPISPPTADAGGPYIGNEGSEITFDASASSDPDGAIVSYEWDLDNDGEYDDATGATPAYTWGDDYSGTIGLRVTDDDGATDTATTTINVLNVTPTITEFTASPLIAKIGEIVIFTGQFTDPGLDDTHTATVEPGRYETAEPGTVTDGNVTASHAYSAAGVYNATLTVVDKDGGSTTSADILVVVYDPEAGFATGGGWFIPGGNTSYNDDYLPDIDGASPANFGFVVKYKPGATNLDGQLEFQYRQGDFNLHSSGMDWLFIVNKNWAKFKGIATIKGLELEGLFPFRVDARDGDFGGGSQPDRFIIKVYEPGVDPDQSDPIYKASGDLEGGSIVIHAKAYEVTRVLRLQTSFPSGHPFMTLLKNFAQAVEQNTSGSVRIELYPRDALVPNIELAKAVKWGDVEMGLIVHGWLAPLSPVMWAGGLPFLYNDDDGLMDAVRGGIGDLMSQELKAHNITAIDWTNLAFAHLFHRTKMLAHPDDVVISDKIRAVGIQEAAVIEWGGTRVLMPPDQVYMALKDGKIGGAAFPLHAYDAYKLYDVARYFCVDYAFANLAGLCINSDVWKSLDAETQQIITTAAGAYVDEMLQTVKQVDAAALDTIKDYGVEVYELSSTERADWRLASEPVWYDWAQGVGDVGQQILNIALSHNP